MTHPTLTAYHLYAGEPTMKLVPAPSQRAWMEATPHKFARRCLPLLIANQAGWHLLNSHRVCVTWNGGIDPSALHIEADSTGPGMAVSHFGSGILTWNIPYLFRTDAGYNLLVRGPVNLPKDGISPLEGLVETWHSSATFTMNWKFTRADVPVTFAVGEPLSLLVPQKRGELENFTPEIRKIEDASAELRAYRAWSEERTAFLHDLNIPGTAAAERQWQKDYFQARGVAQHQTKLTLRAFAWAEREEG